MKKQGYIMIVWMGLCIGMLSVNSADAQKVGDVVQNMLGGDQKLAQGLKEALQIGTTNVIDLVSKLDGFYKNPDIKILLPENMKKTEKILRQAGFDTVIDAFEQSMNHAAETAAGKAKDLLWGAIKEMTIDDAKKILAGKENEATMYFKDKTYQRLEEIFKPMVQTAMGEVGVTKSYQDLRTTIETVFPIGVVLDVDLEQYVTEKTLAGLFFKLSEEERKIRQDPKARVTDLLREVFK